MYFKTYTQLFEKRKQIKLPELSWTKKGPVAYQVEPLDTIPKIESWLEDTGVINYKVNQDLTVDVKGNVSIDAGVVYKKLPVKFGKIRGSFYLDNCKTIETLEGCPVFVRDKFMIKNCNIKNLKGSPRTVKEFVCRDCTSLISLAGVPDNVQCFSIQGSSKLASLKGAPSLKYIESGRTNITRYISFDCSQCDSLETLEHAPDVRIIDASDCKNLKKVDMTNYKNLHDLDLNYCKSLTELKIPSIAKAAFSSNRTMSWYDKFRLQISYTPFENITVLEPHVVISILKGETKYYTFTPEKAK